MTSGPLTDIGNAWRFAQEFGSGVRWVESQKQWYVWDGKRWRPDNMLQVQELAKASTRNFAERAKEEEDDEQYKRLMKHATRSQSASSIRSMLSLACSEPGVPCAPTAFDADPWLLCCANGVIDTRMGTISGHQQGQMISKISPVHYDPAATCPKWEEFVLWCCSGDEEMAEFLHRSIGYSVTGSCEEQVLFFCFGDGENGKSVFLNTIRKMLGDYGLQSAPDLLVSRRGETHPTELADLKGSRFVTAFEIDRGRRWAESRVKQLTGQDAVKARLMRQDFFEFQPSCKLWVSANTKPFVSGLDHAIWRRILLIPFTNKPEVRDTRLEDTLAEEMPGILAWAVRGAKKWLSGGLGLPDSIKRATEEYRSEQDVVGLFIQDECKPDQDAASASNPLYMRYKAWCTNNGEDPLSNRVFSQALTERGYKRKRTSQGVIWAGLSMKRTHEQQEKQEKQPWQDT